MTSTVLKRCFSLLKAWGPAVFWMCLIFSASADRQSVAHSSRIVEPFCRWIYPSITRAQIENVQFVVRKGAHMSEFALLGLLLLYALSTRRGDPRRWMIHAWVLAVVYAAADELHQTFVPGRDGCVRDVVIDATGAALGLLAYYGFLRWRDARKAARPASQTQVFQAVPVPRPTFADRVLFTLQGEDFENNARVQLAIQDRLQRENGGRLILGRNPAAAHLLLKNTSISGQHLALIVRSGQFEVEDLDSSNGTRLNGRRLSPFQPAPLTDNDRLEVGEVLLHFRRST